MSPGPAKPSPGRPAGRSTDDGTHGGSAGLEARSVALDVVVGCLHGEYLAPTLRKALDASDLEGADRSLVADLSYGAVRRLSQLDASLAPYLKAPGKLPLRVLSSLRIATYELLYRGTPSYAAVSAWVEIVKRDTKALAPLANAVLRRVSREAPRDVAADTIVRGAGGHAVAGAEAMTAPHGGRSPDPERDLAIPAWLYASFVESLGEEAARRAALGMLEPEPLWLTSFSAQAARMLTAQGCEVGDGPSLGDPSGAPSSQGRSLRVRSPLPLDRLDAYREGLVQPQNPSSLYAALLLGAGAGELVFDLASGNGVKTAVLAARGARVVAVERSTQRNRAARSNLRRLGLAVQHVAADLVTVVTEELLEKAGEPASKVLLDAPCSGTGTLRGHPEIKLRLTAENVADLARTQAAMLDTAAALVAPGGLLLYAVCSLTPAEGPLQVASFLARHYGFTVREFDPPLPFVAANGAPGRFILPIDGLDGFFLCLLERS